METAYLAAAIIFIIAWSILFILRKDLRREMLIMSLLAMPLGLFDLWAVPLYWEPKTLFDIPIGIEGVIYSFSLGGVAAVLYAEVAHKKLQRVHEWHKSAALLVFAVTLVVFLLLALGNVATPVIILYITLLIGLGVALYLRKDLVRSTFIGAVCFGVLYFVLVKIWLTLYPGAVDWFVFKGLPPLRVWGVPLWELLFGMIFAAYWGNIYEILFGYRLVARSKKTNRKRTIT